MALPFYRRCRRRLAQLTKSSAMAMFPAIGLMLAVSVFENAKNADKVGASGPFENIRRLFCCAGACVFHCLAGDVGCAGKMLYEVYGNAFSYAFQGSRLEVTQDLDPPLLASTRWAAFEIIL